MASGSVFTRKAMDLCVCTLHTCSCTCLNRLSVSHDLNHTPLRTMPVTLSLHVQRLVGQPIPRRAIDLRICTLHTCSYTCLTLLSLSHDLDHTPLEDRACHSVPAKVSESVYPQESIGPQNLHPAHMHLYMCDSTEFVT